MTEERLPYLHAAGAAASAFFLYVLTLAPTTWFWDTSEYIATAHILGIPHPPGNPLFVVVGKVWSLLLAPTGLSVAIRINLLAAVTSALATGFFFLVAHRMLEGWLRAEGEPNAGSEERSAWSRRLPFIGAWAGALLAATSFTVWNQSNVNEKVYTLSVLGIAAVSWLAVLWVDRKDRPGSGWLLVLAVYLMVLGSTNHLMALLPAPAFVALVLLEKPRVFIDRRLLARAAFAVVVGLSFNFFLPIRSAQQPIINEGEPICQTATGAAVAVYSLGRTGCDALAANLTREQYGKPSIFSDPTSDPLNPAPRGMGILGHQLLNYFQYFDWQWSRGVAVSELPGNARLPFTLVFLGLGIWGLFAAGRSRRSHLAYVGVLAFTLSLALVYYLNFRYGYSLAPEHADSTMREVRERDYFFIGSFHLWGFLAGMGIAAAWRWAAGGGFEPRKLALSAPVLILAFVPLFANWGWATRSGDHSARDWAYNLLQSVEPYGVLFTNGDNDTFPLWYLQEVEEIRQDVTVIVVQYLFTDWYPRQLRHHTHPDRQRPFTDEEGLGLYAVPDSPPTRPITTLSDEDLDQISTVILSQDYTITLGETPVQYAAGSRLGRGEQIALAIIQDSLGERPIHFASTGGLARSLNLEGWSLRQGVASQLRMMEDLDELPGVVRVSENLGGEWFDLERSRVLAEEVFVYRGLRDRQIWADRATLNIPWHFYFLYLQLADASNRMGGDEATMEAFLDQADRFLITAQGGFRAVP